MRFKSRMCRMFVYAKRGTRGRRATRWLNDAAVWRAKRKSQDIRHQMKFMSPGKRLATLLTLREEKVTL